MEKKIALIIDDEPSIRLFLEQVLKLKGISTLCAENLGDAEEVLARQKPAFIFVDNYLPDGMGIERIPQLQRKSPESVIIAMTSQYNSQWKNMALKNGARHFLEKPFYLPNLYKAIA